MAVSKTFKTVAIQENQHLKLVPNLKNTMDEVFCEGYTGGKRDKTIDGFYFRCDLKKTAAIAPNTEREEQERIQIYEEVKFIEMGVYTPIEEKRDLWLVGVAAVTLVALVYSFYLVLTAGR